MEEGRRVRALRERLGLTQDELARLLGIRGLTVSRWETGTCALGASSSTVILSALERALERHPDQAAALASFLQMEARRGGLAALLEDFLEHWVP